MAWDTAIAWPPNVNFNPLRDSYTEKIDDNLRSYAPSSGPEVRQQKYSIETDLPKFNLRLTPAEWIALKAFYRTTLRSGSLPFLAKNPNTGTTDTFFFQVNSPPEVIGTKVLSYTVSIALRKVADEVLLVDGDNVTTIDIGDGSGQVLRVF